MFRPNGNPIFFVKETVWSANALCMGVLPKFVGVLPKVLFEKLNSDL
jgi:hypothetical protein